MALYACGPADLVSSLGALVSASQGLTLAHSAWEVPVSASAGLALGVDVVVSEVSKGLAFLVAGAELRSLGRHLQVQ